MARYPYLDAEDLPENQRDLLKRPIALNRQLVNSPDAARQIHNIGHWIRYDSALDPRLRELAILTVGWLARAPYEWSHHVKIGQDFGVTAADISALIDLLETGAGSSLTPLDRAVVQAARELTESTELQDATFAQLNDAMPKDHVINLIVTIGFYNAVVRVLGGLQVDVEPEYQPYLDQFPLPTS